MMSGNSFRWILCLLSVGSVCLGADDPVLSGPSPKRVVTEDPVVKARRDYQVTLAALTRMETRLAELEAAPGVAPETVTTYRAYRDRLRASAQRQRRALEELGVPPVAAGPALAEQAKEAAKVAPRPGPVPPPRIPNEVGRLDRELAESLSDFDGVLMRKQAELAREASDLEESEAGSALSATAEARALLERLEQGGGAGAEGEQGESGQTGEEAGEAAAGGGAGEDKEGQDSAGEGPESASEGSGSSGETSGENQAGAGMPGTPGGVDLGGGSFPESGQGSEQGGLQTGGPMTPQGAGGAGGAAGGTKSEPGSRDRPPATDDDIVARQLRDAAERETDPVLKEKLWREYDAYKKGSGR